MFLYNSPCSRLNNHYHSFPYMFQNTHSYRSKCKYLNNLPYRIHCKWKHFRSFFPQQDE